MIRLWYSNYLERLVDALVANMEGLRQAGLTDPFTPATVIVPNRNIATFLKFEIARRTGIAANLEITYINRFLRDHATLPDDGKTQVKVLTREAIRGLLLSAFDGAAPKPVVDYIEAGDDPDDRERRRYQLSDQLATLFEEYELSRPHMMQLWPQRTVLDEEPYRSTEAWQRQLWLEIFGSGGRVDRLARDQNLRLIRLVELLENATFHDLPPTVHVFGLSYVARLFYSVFQRMSQQTALFIYTLNPCMEYWEDVPAGWRIPNKRRFDKRAAQQSVLVLEGDPHDDELFADPEDPAPLRLWGRPGRDNIRLLNMLTESDFNTAFVDPVDQGDTLLHHIQRDILVRRSHTTPSVPEVADDGTLQILKCPGIQREIEVVANEIWRLVQDAKDRGQELKFSDIAVIVNTHEREAYQARIQSVFQSAWRIPHNIIDIDATSHRRFIEAVDLLFRLPFGEFRRAELLRLITHPNVVASCPGVDPEEWVRWCDDLNIVHGADHEDHEDTYIKGDLYNWDQGLKRLALGTFMNDSDLVFETADGRYLPHELGPQQTHAAARMVTLTRSLIADSRFMRRATMPLAQWIDLAIDLVNTYLEPAEDDDEFDRSRVLARFAELRDEQLVDTPVTWRIAFESVSRVLASIEVSRGQYLAEGVVVSSFLPMRPIPFKVVFVTGMGERQFPRADVKSPLDLRWAKPERWDNFSARRQDEYMFLETLISTRERFYLSYVSRNSRTGEELLPSAVVREFEFMLRRSYIGQDGLEALTHTHPLRRYAPEYFPQLYGGEHGEVNVLPAAHQEAIAVRLKESLDAATFGALDDLSDRRIDQVIKLVDRGAWPSLREHLGLCPVPEPVEVNEVNSDNGAIEVSINRIRRFLLTPLQGAAEFFLGLRDNDEDDLFLVEDEAFETATLPRHVILREVFLEYLRSMHTGPQRTLESLYDEKTELMVLRGSVPSGLFGASDRDKHLATMKQWKQNLDVLKVGKNQPLKVINFGREVEASGIDTEFREPLRLDVPLVGNDGETRQVRVHITGKTDPFDPQLRASMVLKTSNPPMWKSSEKRQFVGGFVDQAVLSMAGDISGLDWRIMVNPDARARPDKHVLELDPFSLDDARAWLAYILGEMLSDVHPYLMPADAIFEHHERAQGATFAAIVERMKRAFTPHSFAFGPIKDYDRYTAPPDAEALIARRMGPFLERMRV